MAVADSSVRCVLMSTDAVGGVWQHTLELAGALRRAGIRAELACLGPPPSAAQRRDAAAIDGSRLHVGPFRLEWMDSPWDDVDAAGRWLLSLEARLRPDVVHLNQLCFGALNFEAPVLVAAHSCVCSWWQAVHGVAAPDEWATYRQRVRAGLEGADAITTPSQAMREDLRLHHGIDPARVQAIPNGRDPLFFAPATRKAPRILCAGRLWDPAKNLGVLEAVAPHLRWPVHAAGALDAPGGATRRPVGITALGPLDARSLAQEMATAAVFVHPARYEPFGQCVLEAALSGCALVLGDIPSLREHWRDCALFAAPDDARGLQRRLRHLIDQPHARAMLATSARARALRLTPARMAGAYAQAYERLVATGRRGSTQAAEREARCAS